MLKLTNVSKTFNLGTVNEKKVLHDINLVLNEGDFVTIIGGNGAGKSTLLNMISGLYPLDCGIITLDGEDISLQPEYQRAKKIGRLFQDPMLGTAGDMQILENLALAKRRGQKRGLAWGVTKSEKQEYYGERDKTFRPAQAGVCRKEHEGESEHDCGQTLVYQVFACWRAVGAVNLAQQDDARARRARKHAEHRKELLVHIPGEERLGGQVYVYEGYDRAYDGENEEHRPVVLKQGQLYCRHARNYHQVECKAAYAVHHEVVYYLLLYYLFLL